MARLFTHGPRKIPPLLSGGVMLSYRCTNACRHCQYRCSPARPDEWMTPEIMDAVMDALAREPQLHGIHLAGGEATLRFDILLRAIEAARSRGVQLDYLETNAHWCVDDQETEDRLTELRQAGLPAVLVSASMFHNEFTPFERTRRCVETARRVFGPHAVLVWTESVYEALANLPAPDQPHSLKEFGHQMGLKEWDPRLTRMYGITPGGRAPEALRRCYPLRPAEDMQRLTCQGERFSTSHFHIDPNGYLVTGLCAGIAAGTAQDGFHPTIEPETMPINDTLVNRGPWGLLELAQEKTDFQPNPEGYASKCAFCFDVRRALAATGEYDELRPVEYYSSS